MAWTSPNDGAPASITHPYAVRCCLRHPTNDANVVGALTTVMRSTRTAASGDGDIAEVCAW